MKRCSPMRSLDICRILDDAARDLGERFPKRRDSLRLHLESTFLRHRCVPSIIQIETSSAFGGDYRHWGASKNRKGGNRNDRKSGNGHETKRENRREEIERRGKTTYTQ